jgi:hypothetical protein
VPVPVVVIPPGFRVNVQVPVAGKPFNTTLPVAREHVGCVIVPTAGGEGIGLTVTVTIVLDGLEQPSGLSASAKYEVVFVGVTGKSSLLALVPRDVPPVPVIYHLIEFPFEVAFRFEDTP